MRFSNIPSDRSSGMAPVICAIEDCDPALSLDFTVTDSRSGQVVGVKRLRGAQSYGVDIAPYVRELLDPAPVVTTRVGFVEKPGHSARVGIAVPGLESGEMVLAASFSDDSAVPTVTRTLCAGQTSEVMVAAPGKMVGARLIFSGAEGTHDVSAEPLQAGKDMVALAIPFDGLSDELLAAGKRIGSFERLEVVITAGNEEILRREYRLAQPPAGAVVLAWLARSGGIESCSFAPLGAITVERDGARAYITRRVISDLLCGDELLWLSEAICSPRVWMVREGENIPVEITDSEVRGEELARTVLTFRPLCGEIIPRLSW